MPTNVQGKYPFNLLRWFSVLALVSIVLISSLSAMFLARFLSHHILGRDAIVTMQFVNSIVRAANAKHANEPSSHVHLTPPQGKHPMTALDHYLAGRQGELPGHSHEAQAGLEAFFQLIAQMPGVLRTNIYTTDRSIAWSSEGDLMGKRFGHNEELKVALSGTPIAHESFAGESGKTEHMVFREPGMRYVENYLPIWADDTTVAAVVEIYRAPQTLFEAVDKGRQLVWLTASLAGLFIYVALFWIVRRADKTIRQQQEQLVESETFSAIGEMASVVAHGIRNPLASVRSSAELALDDGSPGVTRESLTDIVREVDRLGKWIRDLLTYSRPVIGKVDKLRGNDVVSDCLNDFADQLERQAVKLACTMPDGLPCVEVDSVGLRQVFNNIIGNALEAMPDGGELMVASSLTGDRRRLEVSFTDTGYGIPQCIINKVFDPFFSTKQTGVGVGLSLARRIIRRYDGTLNLTSIEGQGTTVTVRIPVAR